MMKIIAILMTIWVCSCYLGLESYGSGLKLKTQRNYMPPSLANIKGSQTWPSLAGDKPPLRGVTRSVSLNGSVAPDQGSFGQYVCCRRVVMFADHVRQCMMKFGNVKMLMLRLEKIVWEGQTAAAPECCWCLKVHRLICPRWQRISGQRRHWDSLQTTGRGQ